MTTATPTTGSTVALYRGLAEVARGRVLHATDTEVLTGVTLAVGPLGDKETYCLVYRGKVDRTWQEV